MKVAISQSNRKFMQEASLLGLSSLLILLIFTPGIVASFGQSQPELSSIKNIGANSFSGISRQSDPVSIAESYSADDNNVLTVQFNSVLPQQQSGQIYPPPNIGSDSFSEFSREDLEEEEED